MRAATNDAPFQRDSFGFNPFRFDQRNLEVRYLTLSSLGLDVRIGQWRVESSNEQVVILPGRGDFLEKYTPLATHLNAAGYSVTSLDWPGQGASGRLGRHPQAGHITSYGAYVDALYGCLVEMDLAAQPMRWLAYSMGAPIALRALLTHRYDVSKLALLSPAFGFAGPPEGFVRVLSNIANTFVSRRFALGEAPTDPAMWRLEQSQVSSGAAAFEAFKSVLLAHPHLLLGGSTWGWVGASLEVFRDLRRADLSKLQVPVLLLSAQDERTVSVDAQKRTVQRLPNAEFVSIPGKHDSLLSQREVVRELFRRVEGFFEETPREDADLKTRLGQV